METLVEPLNQSPLCEEVVLRRLSARLDLDGRAGVLEAEEKRACIFEVLGERGGESAASWLIDSSRDTAVVYLRHQLWYAHSWSVVVWGLLRGRGCCARALRGGD